MDNENLKQMATNAIGMLTTRDEQLRELLSYFWQRASEVESAGLDLDVANAYRDARDKLAAILDGEQ